jgi:hypothetical protein
LEGGSILVLTQIFCHTYFICNCVCAHIFSLWEFVCSHTYCLWLKYVSAIHSHYGILYEAGELGIYLCGMNWIVQLSSTLVYDGYLQHGKESILILLFIFSIRMLFCILICKHKYDVNDISRKLVSSFLIIILKEIIPVRYLFWLYYLTVYRPM